MTDRVSATTWRLIRPDGNLLWMITVPGLHGGALPTLPVRFDDLVEAVRRSGASMGFSATMGVYLDVPVLPPWTCQRQSADGNWETIIEAG